MNRFNVLLLNHFHSKTILSVSQVQLFSQNSQTSCCFFIYSSECSTLAKGELTSVCLKFDEFLRVQPLSACLREFTDKFTHLVLLGHSNTFIILISMNRVETGPAPALVYILFFFALFIESLVLGCHCLCDSILNVVTCH